MAKPTKQAVRASVPSFFAQKRLRAQGTAFVVISHYLQLIEALAPDAVLRLGDGRIAERGDVALAREIARRGFARAEPVEA